MVLINLRIFVVLLIASVPGCVSPNSGGSGGTVYSSVVNKIFSDANVVLDANVFNASTLSQLDMTQLQTLLASAYQENVSEETELDQLIPINNTLCSRLNNLRSQCVSALKIMEGGGDLQLQCDGTISNTAVVAPTFGVKLTSKDSSGTSYLLVANDIYRSNSFTTGNGTQISFSTDGSLQNQDTPAINAIYKLALQRADGNAIDLIPSTTSINFSVNGISLINDLVVASPTSSVKSELLANLNQIRIQSLSDQCRISSSTVTSIIQNAKSSADLTSVKNIPTPSPSSGDITKDWLVNQILLQQSLLQQRHVNLEDSRNRETKLSAELGSQTAVGCKASQPLTSLTIALNGTISLKDPLPQTDAPMKSSVKNGDCASLVIRLSNDFAVTFPANSIVGGSIDVPGIPSTLLVGSINQLSINKNGSCIENQLITNSSCAFLTIGCTNSSKFQNWETNIPNISGITISANGETFYQNNSVGFSLNRTGLNWQDLAYFTNPAYIKIMQETNCNVNH